MTFGRLPRIATLVLALLVALVGFVPSAGAAARPRTGVAINHSTIKLGKTATLHGRVSPNQAGRRVVLQQRSGSHWKTIQRHKLNSSSKYSFTVRPRSSGLKRFRIVALSSSVSRIVRLHVKAKASGGGSGSSGGGSSCTPGYSPCIPPASDVDCAGGSGDGPAYVEGPVYVTGSDPYDLDRDGDGVGCDS